MKGKGGPGRGNVAVVMHFVNEPVYFGQVHPAMEPVVIGLVNECSYQKADG